MNSKKMNLFIRISLILLILDIFIISSINIPNIKIHDIAIIFLILGIIFSIKDIKINYILQKIILNSSSYFLYLLFTNYIFFINGNVNIKFIFFILKEVEYILAMIMFIYIIIYYTDDLIKLLKFGININVIYGTFQLMSGKISYYGIGSIGSIEPSISGNIYFICSILAFIIYVYNKEKKQLYMCILSYLLTIFTVSRTNILGLTFFYSMYIIVSFIRRRKISFKFMIISNCIVIFFIIITIIFNNLLGEIGLLEQVFTRFSNEYFNRSYSIRMGRVNYFLNYFITSLNSLLIGSGKGVVEYTFNFNSLAVDNQYARFIIEIGIIGILIWAYNIIYISKIIYKTRNLDMYIIYISLLGSYLFMGMGFEVFQVTKAGLNFWISTGLILGVSMTSNVNKKYYNLLN